jgi:hypothetical protein
MAVYPGGEIVVRNEYGTVLADVVEVDTERRRLVMRPAPSQPAPPMASAVVQTPRGRYAPYTVSLRIRGQIVYEGPLEMA